MRATVLAISENESQPPCLTIRGTTDLTATLEFMDPVDGVNHFQYINELPLDNLMKQEPMKVYEGVVRIFTLSDRYAALW